MELEFTNKVKEKAQSMGFHLVAVASAKESSWHEFYEWWLQQGFAAGMNYLHYQKEKRKSLRHIHPKAKSVVVCALAFEDKEEEKEEKKEGREKKSERGEKGYGKVARYAKGKDYHLTMKEKLEELARFIDREKNIGEEDKSLAYVDTGAISERSLGKEAGIGWIGKNSMLIHPKEGSWFYLGEVITSIELRPDAPMADHCGTCRRCIDACPTGAILENLRAIDSRKCISYLTIEHKGEIPAQYHTKIGNWLMGCDICQEVCPWNNLRLQKRRKSSPSASLFPLEEIFSMDKKAFKEKYSKTALSRPKLEGLKRNAKILEENQKE